MDYLWALEKYASLFANNVFNFASSILCFCLLEHKLWFPTASQFTFRSQVDSFCSSTTEKVCFLSLS